MLARVRACSLSLPPSFSLTLPLSSSPSLSFALFLFRSLSVSLTDEEGAGGRALCLPGAHTLFTGQRERKTEKDSVKEGERKSYFYF
jgi:hypothetical protein